jgi:hypothetical protein
VGRVVGAGGGGLAVRGSDRRGEVAVARILEIAI